MTSISFQAHKDYELANMLVIDGVPDPTSRVNDFLDERWATVVSEEVAAKLKPLSCGELAKSFSVLQLPVHVPNVEWIKSVTFAFSHKNRVLNRINFNFEFDLAKWASPWSIVELVNALERRVRQSAEFYYAPSRVNYGNTRETAVARWDLSAHIDDPHASASSVISARTPQALKLIEETFAELRRQAAGDVLLTTFQFPEDVSAACQQYLAYFVQFLRDLGVDATSDIQQDAAEVLFSVKPKSGAEALEVVREALRVYLRLPSAPEFIAASDGERDFAVAQLRANVMHLQSQLVLANAIVQAKDAAIDALKLSNFQLQQLQLVHHDRSGNEGLSEKEPLISDVVSVTKYEGQGFEIDLPKLLRRLKRKSRGN